MAGEGIQVPTVHQPRGYAHAVRSGNTVYIAGQIGLTPDGSLVGADFEAQANQALTNLRLVLEAVGASFRDVVKVTAFLTDPTNVSAWREIRARHYGDYQPASTLLIVAGLAAPEFLIEVEATAVLDS